MDGAIDTLIRAACVVGALTTAAALHGCSSSEKSGGAAGMNQAVSDYHAQRYSQAHDQAVDVQDKPVDSGQREDAAYLAGLSAYQLGELDEAERRFIVASRSSNSETSAKAKAMLGQIRLDQHRPRDAAALFVEAAPNLSGEDARQCAYNAGVAYQQAGDHAAAKKWLAQSGLNVTTRTAGAPSTAAMKSGTVAKSNTATSQNGFTLQVGAFKEKSRAQKAASEAQKLATKDGLGSVKIQTRRDQRGSLLYVVQFGSFPTREAAAAARARISRLDYIVAPA